MRLINYSFNTPKRIPSLHRTVAVIRWQSATFRNLGNMIAQEIYRHAHTHPEHTAAFRNGKPISYRRFAQRIELLRMTWGSLNLRVGSVAVVVVENRLLDWTAVLALQALGVITLSADSFERAISLNLTNVGCVLVDSRTGEQSPRAEQSWPTAMQLKLPDSFFEIAQGISLPDEIPIVGGGGHLLYTSGTTGTYKKLFHDASLDGERGEQRGSATLVGASSVVNVIFFGLWTAVGYRWPLMVWHHGGSVVFDHHPGWPTRLANHGVTHVLLTPGQLQEAVKALDESSDQPLGAFELRAIGGFVSPKLVHAVRRAISPNLVLSFGSTELWTPAMQAIATGSDEDYWLQGMGNRVIEIVDGQGDVCQDGTEGLLRVKMEPFDYSLYVDDAASTARMFQDGWFYPGDIAVGRADHRIRVLGRTADVINVRGTKMASGPIEDVIRNALGVSAVCAFSGLLVGDEDRLLIAVESEQTVASERLKAVASQVMSRFGKVTFVQVKAFPLTQSGTLKIDRIALRRGIVQAQRH